MSNEITPIRKRVAEVVEYETANANVTLPQAAPRVHHAARRRGGRVAARGAGAGGRAKRRHLAAI
jgi:hypothetical protein